MALPDRYSERYAWIDAAHDTPRSSETATEIETRKQIEHHASQGQAQNAAPTITNTPKFRTLKDYSPIELMQMMVGRLRIRDGDRVGWEHADTYVVDNDKVLVFIVAKGQHVVLEDDGQFPSDTLVGQLRLIIE